jgi:hypothetical protein
VADAATRGRTRVCAMSPFLTGARVDFQSHTGRPARRHEHHSATGWTHMSTRWQYKVEEVKSGAMGGVKPDAIEERLTKLGQQGWELVNAVYATQWGPTLLFFKRPA